MGNEIEIAPPCGEFFLDITEQHERPLVLLAAGVGITPIMSMLLSALEAMGQRKIIFIHASLNEQVQAFKSTVDALEKKHPNLKASPRSCFRFNIPHLAIQTLLTTFSNCLHLWK